MYSRKCYEVLKIPSNLNFDQLIENNPPTNYEGVKPDYLAFLCHTIARLEAYYRSDRLKEGGFVPLDSQILHRYVYSYRQCLLYLTFVEVIETDRCYSVGEFCKGYQFSQKYKGSGFTDYQIKSSEFKRHLGKLNAEAIAKNLESCSQQKHLVKFFDPQRLHIDKEKAFGWIDDEESREISEISKEKDNSADKQVQMEHALHKFHLYRLTVENFHEGDFYFVVDKTGYRFHSSLMSMKRELRNFISYDGDQLVSLDIKNSQPFLVQILFQESFYLKGRDKSLINLYNLFPEMYDYLSKNGQLKKLKWMCRQANGLTRRIVDFRKYKEWVSSGLFYENLSEEINKDHRTRYRSTRDKVKKQSLAILFSDPDLCQTQMNNGVRKFKEIFPNVYEVFSTFKTDGYNKFAWLMQRMESRLILDCISKRFHKLHPDAPILTIHDNVVTTKGKVEELKKTTEEEVHKSIGEKPIIKEEPWIVPQNIETNDNQREKQEIKENMREQTVT